MTVEIRVTVMELWVISAVLVKEVTLVTVTVMLSMSFLVYSLVTVIFVTAVVVCVDSTP